MKALLFAGLIFLNSCVIIHIKTEPKPPSIQEWEESYKEGKC